MLDDLFAARALTARGEERERLWRLAAEQWPPYDDYAEQHRPADPGRRARTPVEPAPDTPLGGRVGLKFCPG